MEASLFQSSEESLCGLPERSDHTNAEDAEMDAYGAGILVCDVVGL